MKSEKHKDGAFIFSRSVFNSEIWYKPPEYFKVFFYLVGKASFKDRIYKGYSLKRGQCFCVYTELQKQLEYNIGYRKKKYNDSFMKNLMKYLRSTLMITTMKKPRGLIVTICNYDAYQDLSLYEKTNEETTENTTNKLRMSESCRAINKKEKEREKEKKEKKEEERKKNNIVEPSSTEKEDFSNGRFDGSRYGGTDSEGKSGKDRGISLESDNENRPLGCGENNRQKHPSNGDGKEESHSEGYKGPDLWRPREALTGSNSPALESQQASSTGGTIELSGSGHREFSGADSEADAGKLSGSGNWEILRNTAIIKDLRKDSDGDASSFSAETGDSPQREKQKLASDGGARLDKGKRPVESGKKGDRAEKRKSTTGFQSAAHEPYEEQSGTGRPLQDTGGSKPKVKGSCERSPVNPKKPKHLTLQVIDLYVEGFQAKFGELPLVHYGKDGAIAKRLLTTYTIHDLRSLLKKFFDSQDAFINQTGFTFGVFSSVVQKLSIAKKTNKKKDYGSPLTNHNVAVAEQWLKQRKQQEGTNK